MEQLDGCEGLDLDLGGRSGRGVVEAFRDSASYPWSKKTP